MTKTSRTPGAELYRPRRHLSISTLTKASGCLRKAFYSGVGLAADGFSGPMVYGTALHAAIPVALTEGLQPAMQWFDEIWTDPPEDSELYDKKRNRKRAISMMENLLTHFEDKESCPFKLIEPPDSIKVQDDTVNPYEVEFYLDIGLSVPLYGRVDGIAKTSQTDELWCVEYKTSSEVSERMMQGLSYSPQTVGYPGILRRLGLPVSGTIMVYFRVSPSKDEVVFHPIPVSEDQENSFFDWAREEGTKILDAQNRNVWPKNLASCGPYPVHHVHGYVCEYAPLCHAVADWRTLEDVYRTDWDPDPNTLVHLTVKGKRVY